MEEGLIAHCRRMALYNRLANERLYAACALLDDAALKQDRRAFFRSIHGTLNHILLGDRIWMTRFAGGTAASTGLDAILYADFAELRAARTAEDAGIERFMAALAPAFFSVPLRYINNAGLVKEDPADIIVTHFFNHQIHHRGQVHGMLSQAGVAPPSLDLHRVLRP